MKCKHCGGEVDGWLKYVSQYCHKCCIHFNQPILHSGGIEAMARLLDSIQPAKDEILAALGRAFDDAIDLAYLG